MPETRPKEQGNKRLAVSVTTAVDRQLEDLSEQQGTTKSELIRRALNRDLRLLDHRRAGRRIIVEDPDGTRREIEFID